jgi:hypothetical protein
MGLLTLSGILLLASEKRDEMLADAVALLEKQKMSGCLI